MKVETRRDDASQKFEAACGFPNLEASVTSFR